MMVRDVDMSFSGCQDNIEVYKVGAEGPGLTFRYDLCRFVFLSFFSFVSTCASNIFLAYER
jgi:hypothetical protein